MDQTQKDDQQLKATSLAATEIMYLLGVAFLFIGLWIWAGIGPAFSLCGGVLISTALINARERHQLEAGNAI